MHSTDWQPLIAAAVGLLVAVCGYLSARVNQNTRSIAEHLPQIAAAAAAGAAQRGGHDRRGSGLAGGGTPYPLWNQLADPLSTGQLPGWRSEECGEECVAEVLYRTHGVSVNADALRYQLGGPGRRGLTTGEDLVRLLALNNCAARLEETPAAHVAGEIQIATQAGRAAIALGAWVTPGVLHWVLVTRSDEHGCSYNDPWGGVRTGVGWADFRARYAGTLVIVTRAPDPSL